MVPMRFYLHRAKLFVVLLAVSMAGYVLVRLLTNVPL